MKQTGLALFVMGTAVVMPAQAHHSFPATYFVDQSVTIEGTVVQFLFRNPHSFVHVLAPDKDGTMQRWAVEWGAGGALAQDNVDRDTLKPGDKVVIKGQPGRNPADHRIRMQAIEDKTANWKWAGTFG
jgi:DNA/RNA endonuclease YhcR with UshA esterase domain